MATPAAEPIGTPAETNDTNEMTNEVVINPDGSKTIRKIRKKRRFEKPTESLIEKVQRHTNALVMQGNAAPAPDVIKLDPSLEAFVKLKLVEWDADASGSFSHEEVCAAMDDLREQEGALRKLKWQFLQYFSVIFLFLGCMLGAVFLVLKLTTESTVSSNAELRAPVPNAETKQTAIVELTAVRENGGLGQLLDYDKKNDQWLISDSQLRLMDQVSFKTLAEVDPVSGATTLQAFYNLDLAEIIRIDAGSTGTNDQVNMITTGGHDLRLWENVSQLQIRWKGTAQWRTVDVDGSAAPKKAGGRRLEDMNLGVETAGDPLDVTALEPPGRRLGKGGVIFVGYHHGHAGHGGGGGGCQGRCNVPYGTVESCSNFCNIGACYEHRAAGGSVATYQCNGVGGLMTPLSKLLWQSLTIFVLVRAIFC